jgi:hypothetical protein
VLSSALPQLLLPCPVPFCISCTSSGGVGGSRVVFVRNGATRPADRSEDFRSGPLTFWGWKVIFPLANHAFLFSFLRSDSRPRRKRHGLQDRRIRMCARSVTSSPRQLSIGSFGGPYLHRSSAWLRDRSLMSSTSTRTAKNKEAS